MNIGNRLLRGVLLACVLSPAWTAAPASAVTRVTKDRSEKFQCVGVGRGHHAKNMSEAQCLKAGGTVQRGGMLEQNAPASKRAIEKAPASRPAEKKEGRRAIGAEDKFGCRGIGTGHHTKGMTREECVNKGGTVEEAR